MQGEPKFSEKSTKIGAGPCCALDMSDLQPCSQGSYGHWLFIFRPTIKEFLNCQIGGGRT